MKFKYVILGAGITGLSIGEKLNPNEYYILEKESNKGGYCRTIKRNGYIWDYSGHFFHFKTKEMERKFVEYIGIDNLVKVRKNTKIYYESGLIDYPFQKNIHQLPKQDFIECLYELFHREKKCQYENFLGMLYGKFGIGIVEKFLKPYNEKLYACDLNQLDVDAMGRFFPYADINEIIDNMKKNSDNASYNDYFWYPKQGAYKFVDSIRVPDEKIAYECNIKNIDVTSKKIMTNYGEIEYEYLISTIPFPRLLELCNRQMKLSWNKVLVINIGFDRKTEITDIHWIYVPDKQINFYRIGFYDNILSQDKGSVYLEIGYSSDEMVDVEYELKKALEGMKKMGVIQDQKVVDWDYVIMNPAYVHIHNQETVRDMQRELEKSNVYTAGRYGIWTYSSIEDCIESGMEILRRVDERENTKTYN